LPAAQLDQIAQLKRQLDVDGIRGDILTLLDESREGTSRVMPIVRDLKNFSRAGDDLEWQRADLHAGLDSTLNIVQNELKYKAEVVKEYGALPAVECLPSQLNQVFMNLLVNAGQAIIGHGKVTIATGKEGSSVWIRIGDNGPGIAPENLKRIFDPFFTTKPVGQGTGLGLSMSYGIVAKHHGRIEVASQPGEGTSFCIWLPIDQAPPAVIG
jgi:signal transduction histidine kinase